MVGVILGEKASQEEEDDGHDGEEFLRRRKLHAAVQLLPLRQISRFALVHGHPGGPFSHMKQEEVAHVVNGIREGPRPGCAEPGVDEKQEMEDNCDDDIRRPCPFRVEPGVIGVETPGTLTDYHGVTLGFL